LLQVGHTALHEHEPPGGIERRGMISRAENFRLPYGSRSTTGSTPQEMCEKSWTLPLGYLRYLSGELLTKTYHGSVKDSDRPCFYFL